LNRRRAASNDLHSVAVYALTLVFAKPGKECFRERLRCIARSHPGGRTLDQGLILVLVQPWLGSGSRPPNQCLLTQGCPVLSRQQSTERSILDASAQSPILSLSVPVCILAKEGIHFCSSAQLSRRNSGASGTPVAPSWTVGCKLADIFCTGFLRTRRI
jgi:hypothetical protein